MTTDRSPLLGSRRSGDPDQPTQRADADEEDEALQTSSGRSRIAGVAWPTRLRELMLFAWALLATALVIVLAVWMQHSQQTSPQRKPAGKRNLIFMVSDGMGPASLSLTRSYRQYVEGLPINDTLSLDRHFWGTSRTRSSNSLVTDSAAGATAFGCGEKSYNGAIGVVPDGSACGTVLEAAKKAGYLTGLVVTTDITDATPACFASHVAMRMMQDEIALQEVGEGPLGRVVDLMLGGGRCHFLPASVAGGCRNDSVDVTKLAQEKHGWNYFNDRAGFDSMWSGKNVTLPTLGLFAPGDIPFEIDRRHMANVFPSLSEMAITALKALEIATKDSDKGFFLMIEGSRIDHAGHINDPAAQVREVIEYDKAFKSVVDFLEASDTEGVLVATSDHETGGLATALQEPGHLPVYNWYPRALANANASSELLNLLLHNHIQSGSFKTSSEKKSLKNWINTELVIKQLGIIDATEAELESLVTDPDYALITFAEMVSLRAHVGWSTHGHTAVDVNIYSSGGPNTEAIRGNVENTDIGKFLRNYLSLNVDDITKELNEKLATTIKYNRLTLEDETVVGLHPEWIAKLKKHPKRATEHTD